MTTLPDRSPTRTRNSEPNRAVDARARLIAGVLDELESRGCRFVGPILTEHRRLALELDRLEGGLPPLRRVA